MYDPLGLEHHTWAEARALNVILITAARMSDHGLVVPANLR